MKTINITRMENITAGDMKCFAGVTAGVVVGFAGGTGNGVAFLLGPVGVTWGAISAIGGGVMGALTFC